MLFAAQASAITPSPAVSTLAAKSSGCGASTSSSPGQLALCLARRRGGRHAAQVRRQQQGRPSRSDRPVDAGIRRKAWQRRKEARGVRCGTRSGRPRLGGGPRASTPGDSTTSCTTAPWPWPCLIPQERVPQLGDRLPDSQCEIAGYCSRTRRSNAARQSWDAFHQPGCRWRFGWRCGLRRGLGKAAAYQWTLLPVVGRSCASLLRTNESLHDSAELGDEDASV